MADSSIGPGTVLAGRYRLDDLLSDHAGARFWRATDQMLARSVAVHVLAEDDRRAEPMLGAARTSATVTDAHFLRVLDAAREQGVVYVVTEWGQGVSLDLVLAEATVSPRRAAWLVKEVAEAIHTAHEHGVAHGRLLPENVILTEAGAVKLIGFVVDAVLNGHREPLPPDEEPLSNRDSDVVNLAALLYAALVGRWAGTPGSGLPDAPREHGRPLRPRRVRAGVPKALDTLCQRVLNKEAHRHLLPVEGAHEIAHELARFVGDPSGLRPVVIDQTQDLDRDEIDDELIGDEPGTEAIPAGTDDGPDPGNHPAPEAGAGAQPDSASAPDTAPGSAVQAQTPGAETPGEDAPDDGASGLDETQAGSPVFRPDDTAVGWHNGNDDGAGAQPTGPAVPPESAGSADPDPSPSLPPDAGEPPHRPLFADDAPRRDRGSHGSGQEAGPPAGPASSGALHTGLASGSMPEEGYWPWASDGSSPETEQEPKRGADAGKSWLRLAGAIAACLAVLVAVVFAFNLGQGSGGSPSSAPTPSDSGSSSASRVLDIAGVADFDPQADPPEENPERARLAADGDPKTSWITLRYEGDPQLGNLKDGVGLLVDLGSAQRVSRVDVTLRGRPTTLQILAAPEGDTAAPASTDGLSRVASKSGAGGETRLELSKPTTTRYLVVWLTSLPPVQGGYRGEIAEITVHS